MNVVGFISEYWFQGTSQHSCEMHGAFHNIKYHNNTGVLINFKVRYRTRVRRTERLYQINRIISSINSPLRILLMDIIHTTKRRLFTITKQECRDDCNETSVDNDEIQFVRNAMQKTLPLSRLTQSSRAALFTTTDYWTYSNPHP